MNFMEDTKKDVTEIAIKAGINGVMVAFVARMLFDERGDVEVPFLGNLDVMYPLALSGAIASSVSDTFDKTVLNRLNIPVESKNISALAVKGGLAGVALCIPMKFIFNILPVSPENLLRCMGLGAFTKFSADWVVENVVLKSEKGFII